MGLSSGFRLGGAYVDVGLRFDQLDKDLSELQRRMRSESGKMSIGSGSGASSGGSSSGGGGGFGGGALLVAVRHNTNAITGAIRDAMAGVHSAVASQSKHLESIARSSAQAGKALVGQVRSSRDVFRTEKRMDNFEAVRANAASLMSGTPDTRQRRKGFAALPADVRFLGGFHLETDQGGPPAPTPAPAGLARPGSGTGSGTGLSADLVTTLKGIAATIAKSHSAIEAIARTVAGSGKHFRNASLDPTTGEIKRRAHMAANPTRGPKSILDATGQRRRHKRSGFVGVGDQSLFQEGDTSTAGKMARVTWDLVKGATAAGGAMAGLHLALANTGAILPVVAVAAKAGGLGLATMGAAALSLGPALIPVGVGLAAFVASTRIGRIAWNGFTGAIRTGIGAIRAVERGVDRFTGGLKQMWKYLRIPVAVVVSPFRLMAAAVRGATSALGLFNRRAATSSGFMGRLGGIAGGLGNLLAAPFRLALSPIRGVISGLRAVMGHLTLIGPALAVAFVVRGVKAAVDFTETLNKAQHTFQGTFDVARRFASEMAGRFGLVEQKVLDVSSGFGLLFTGSGVKQGVADLSNRMAGLAADTSSFFNVSMSDAADSMQSALRGQFRSISQFGVIITAEGVKAKAVAMGLADSIDDVGQKATMLARAQLIFEGLSTASGDLARTMNQPANLFRELRGRIENAAGALGAAFLPAWRELLLLLNDVASGGGTAFDVIKSAAETIGTRIKDAIHFVRQMWASWNDGVAIVKLAIRQMVEWAKYGVGYIRDAFSALFDWLRENWRPLAMNMAEQLVAAFQWAITNVRTLMEERSVRQRLAEKGVSAEDAMALAQTGQGDFGTGFLGDRLLEIQKERDEALAKFGPMNAGTTEIKLPDFHLPQTFAAEIRALAEKISATKLRGDEPEGGPRGQVVPEVDPEETARDKEKSRVGELLGAREMLAMLQKSSAEKERDKAAMTTAKNTGEMLKVLGEIRNTGFGGAQMA